MAVKLVAGATGSPSAMPNISVASCALLAPMSMKSSLMGMTLVRLSSERKCGGVLEMTPRIFSPLLVRITTRWASMTCGHQPPMGTNLR